MRPRQSDRYLLVRVTVPAHLPSGTYLRVAARFFGYGAVSLSTDQRVLAATVGSVMSALFAIPPQTERVELSLGNAFGPGAIVLTRPQIHVLSARNPISLESLGRTYVVPTEIPGAIRDLVRAFGTHRGRVIEFSVRSRWSDSAALLVSYLMTRSAEAKDRAAEAADLRAAP